MVTIQGELVIERPREEVFNFVADGENEPRYHAQMRVAKKITEGPIGVGHLSGPRSSTGARSSL